MSTNFNVLDMAKEINQSDSLDGLFDIPDESNDSTNAIEVEEEIEVIEEIEEVKEVEVSIKEPEPTPVKKPWTPDEKLLDDLPEYQVKPAVYDKEDVKFGERKLVNGAEEEAKEMLANTKNELERMTINIEYAKKQRGISKLGIPEGPEKTQILNAASDPDFDSAQEGITAVLDPLLEKYPELVLERIGAENNQDVDTTTTEPVTSNNEDKEEIKDITEDIVNIIIDKSQANQVVFTEEELEKISFARKVELNIVESDSLKFSEIEDVEENVLDQIMSQYVRHNNDIDSALPASRYRATFRGLSYPEVLDLNNSNKINTLDAEKLKWSIVFKHIYNMSIGPWQEYKYYMKNNTEVKLQEGQPLPPGVTPDDVLTHSKFDDFLKKTSYMDIEFLLWKILCATSLEKELISMRCHATNNGIECKNEYDWIYSPSELINTNEISPEVMEEMKITGEVSSKDAIMENFNSGPVMSSNTVELPHSKFHLLFGHISAYDYLNRIYADIEQFANSEIDENDPTLEAKAYNYTMLAVIKGVLVPKQNGHGWYRITGSDAIVQILHSLDEVDWQAAYKIYTLMTEPYQFTFELKDVTCPKCHNTTSVPINNMSELLFILARTLSSVQVDLVKR